jgi:hypothetical protein
MTATAPRELRPGDIWIGRDRMRRILGIFDVPKRDENGDWQRRVRIAYSHGGDHDRDCYQETFRKWIASAGAKLDRAGKK